MAMHCDAGIEQTDKLVVLNSQLASSPTSLSVWRVITLNYLGMIGLLDDIRPVFRKDQQADRQAAARSGAHDRY